MARMINKGVRLNDYEIERLEKVAKKLNEEAGTNVFDFSQLVRIAINQYLNREDIKPAWEEK